MLLLFPFTHKAYRGESRSLKVQRQSVVGPTFEPFSFQIIVMVGVAGVCDNYHYFPSVLLSFWLPAQLVQLLCPTLAKPWTVPCQAPLSVGFSRQEYWSGYFLLQGIFPTLGLLHCMQILYQLSYEGSPIAILTRLNLLTHELDLSLYFLRLSLILFSHIVLRFPAYKSYTSF